MDLVEREEKYRREQEELYQELRENPIDLDALFQTVVKAVHYDYVGFESKRRYFMPGEYHTYVFSRYRFGSLTMETLVRSLHQFAGDMHDRRLRFDRLPQSGDEIPRSGRGGLSLCHLGCAKDRTARGRPDFSGSPDEPAECTGVSAQNGFLQRRVGAGAVGRLPSHGTVAGD